MTIPAAAGEGIPKKFFVCSLRFSILNLANLRAAQTVKNKLNIQPIWPNLKVYERFISNDGANPKLIKSDRESNSAPNCEDFFNFLATQPSKKSKKAASMIIKTAKFQSL